MSKVYTVLSGCALMLALCGTAAAQGIPTVPTGAPVAGPLGLGLLTLAVAGTGAVVLRRKK